MPFEQSICGTFVGPSLLCCVQRQWQRQWQQFIYFALRPFVMIMMRTSIFRVPSVTAFHTSSISRFELIGMNNETYVTASQCCVHRWYKNRFQYSYRDPQWCSKAQKWPWNYSWYFPVPVFVRSPLTQALLLGLAVVLVGQRKDSQAYVGMKKKWSSIFNQYS